MHAIAGDLRSAARRGQETRAEPWRLSRMTFLRCYKSIVGHTPDGGQKNNPDDRRPSELNAWGASFPEVGGVRPAPG
jgi:hypothetical protein